MAIRSTVALLMLMAACAALYAQNQPPAQKFEWVPDQPAASRPQGAPQGGQTLPLEQAAPTPEPPPMEPPPPPKWWQTAYGLNKRGAKEHEKGDFEAAARRHAQALALKPGDETLAYNLGTALAGGGRAGEALKTLGEVVRATDGRPQREPLRASALYNAGGALASGARWAEAAEAYRESLRLNPADADAKRNYEIALRKQKEEEQNAQQNQNDEGKEGEQDEEEQPQDGEQEGEEKQSPGELSREEAEKLLQALQQYEKEALEEQEEKKRRVLPGRGAFDW